MSFKQWVKDDPLQSFRASVLIALSGILYGFLGYFGTNALREHMPVAAMLFWRFLIASSWILLFVVRKYSLISLTQIVRPQVLLVTFLLGAAGYAGSSELYFLATRYSGTGLAMVIFYTYPMIVGLTAWIKDRKSFNSITMFSLIIMMVGLFLLRDSSAQHLNVAGITLAVMSAFFYAVYVMGTKQISAVIGDSNLTSVIISLGCAFIFLLASLSTRHFMFPPSSKSWLSLVLLGIFSTALPIQLMLEGLKHVSAMRASIISVLEPLVTVLVGLTLLGESLTHWQWLGMMIVLISASLIQFQNEQINKA